MIGTKHSSQSTATVSKPSQPIPWVTIANYAVLSLGIIVVVFPFLWMVLSAFKTPDEVIAYPPTLFPENPTFDNIRRIWQLLDFQRLFFNSLLVATVATSCQLITSALVGYVLAKYRFRGRNVLFIMILSTMMIPWPILILPQYLIVRELKLIDTYWALILPALYSSFGIFMMRQFMHSIPNELIDAARIDGASEPRIFSNIILPLTGPALAALGIFHFLWHWESFIWPLIVINSEDMFTLPLGLASRQGQYTADYAGINAGALIAVIPVLVVFLLLQRYFIEGITLTGLKG